MRDKESGIKERFETINRLLQEEYVVVHVDASIPGVVLPSHLTHNHSVTLKLSKFFRGGIEVTTDKIVTNLLFDNDYFECTIPLTAIWGVTSVNRSNIVWPESAPKEILKKISDSPAEKEQKTKKPSHLRRIK